MLTKNERNAIKALRSKDNRLQQNQMVVEGFKSILELLKSRIVVERIYITSGIEESSILNEIKVLASTSDISLCDVSNKDMDIMSSLKSAPGILAVGKLINSPVTDVIDRLKQAGPCSTSCIIILDDLVDPGNVGTLIRTAEWFGFAGVICSERTADIWNPKTIQASMGSVFRIPIGVASPIDVIKDNNLKAVALEADGENLYNDDFIPNAIVIGSESHGITPALSKVCAKTWSIPGKGHTESLNAAIAGAIVSAELARRTS
jgi:TrmH family RNA methyltransferase